MSRHEGVSCDNCLRSNFEGKRFKCLICYDYDLCEDCCHSMLFLASKTSRHSADHPMQCILTRNLFEKYYAGESVTPEMPQSLVCPLCCKPGFTKSSLRDHIVKEHKNNQTEVICPLCAALPSGDPNFVTQDLARHLADDHRSHDADDSFTNRPFQRRGIRTRNIRMSNTSNNGTTASNNNASASVRESVDPIAELLNQLSGVRRSAQQLQNVTNVSHLQELQAQLTFERQRASEIRQQLERFPPKFPGSTSSSPNSNAHPPAGLTVKGETIAKKSPARPSEEDDSKFLLSSIDKTNSTESEKQQLENEDIERSQFVQELLLSMLATDYDSKQTSAPERATPVECPVVFLAKKDQTSHNNNSCVTSIGNCKTQVESKSDHVIDVPNSKPESSLNDNTANTVDSLAQAVQSVGISGDLGIEAHDTSQQYDSSPLSSPRPPAGTRCNTFERSQPDHYRGADFDDEKDSDDDKPAMPRQQTHNIRIQGLIYQQESVRVGGVSNSARLNYSHDDLTTSDVVGKHVQ